MLLTIARKDLPLTPATSDRSERSAKRNELIERALSALKELPQQITPNDDIQVFDNYVATRMRKLNNSEVAERKINMVLLQCIDEEEPPAKNVHVIVDIPFTILGENDELFDGNVHKSFRIIDGQGIEVDGQHRSELATLYEQPNAVEASEENLTSNETLTLNSGGGRRSERAKQ